jgi:serine/threonine protein kinase
MAQPHSSSYSYLDALTWATDIAAAVAHLHSLNPLIIHRDLKLENILLLKPSGADSTGRKLPVAKLTDFGLHVVSYPQCCLDPEFDRYRP